MRDFVEYVLRGERAETTLRRLEGAVVDVGAGPHDVDLYVAQQRVLEAIGLFDVAAFRGLSRRLLRLQLAVIIERDFVAVPLGAKNATVVPRYAVHDSLPHVDNCS